MPIYFAPLEGVTDAVYRRTHRACFSGVSKYFIPFISPTQNLLMTARELSAVAPEHNVGVPAVPQVLCKDADHFLWAAQSLSDMGYAEVNLNVGCPSGTVTAKGKGAGMLMDAFALERFLDRVFSRAPMAVSVKTRLGFSDPEEFDELLALYERYPISELTIHARTRSEFYKGEPHREVFAAALAHAKLPLVYNGDLFTASDCRAMEAAHPTMRAMMLGRGLIANPALAQEAAGGAPLSRDALKDFHDKLLTAYQEIYPAHVALGRMRESMKHMVCCFENPEKPRKAFRKATTLRAYEDAAARLFAEHALRNEPGFLPE